MRAARELEAPSENEGFVSVERRPFVRAERRGSKGLFIAATAVDVLPLAELPSTPVPCLVFDWRPGADGSELGEAETVASLLPGPVEAALCPHPGGPPICWCRPPLPGLPLAFARRHGVDPTRSAVVGVRPAHRTLANALGARYIAVD
jgi:hypothetical protein